MKRRSFVKTTALGATALSLSKWIDAPTVKNNDSAFLKLICNSQFPQFDFFSIDSLGKNMLQQNVALKPDAIITQMKYYVNLSNNSTQYFLYDRKENTTPAWEIIQKQKTITIISNYHENDEQSFLFNISQYANHATLLGIIEGNEQKVNLPAILHFPDMGTMRVTCRVTDQKVDYDAKRFIDHPYVRINLPAATKSNPTIEYNFEVVTIHPGVKGIENDSRYDCFRRNFISIFQLNPFLKILANNSASDACAFTLYEYAEVALHTPNLVNDLYAMDLIKMTLDRYLNGTKGYGMLGYDYDKTWDIPESDTTCNTLDTYPSLLISACNYAISTNDKTWFAENYLKLKVWIDKILKTDFDNDGLFEFCLSGNTGSWKGDPSMRPANWWDTIGFGHKDAYSNALAYYALTLLEQAHAKFDMHDEAALYKSKADQLKNIYTKTFYNDATGILAGWKSTDGKLHDYWFVFVNAVAICYDLVETSLANSIMDKILAKMKEVGFTNFELGLPGNLIPVIRADYTDLKPEVGGGKREDNLDGFQIYENGGATACFTYFTIRALQKLGRKQDADMILLPLLKSMSEGGFQGKCADNGRTKDWKTWTGECWGYEGFLVDNYMFLLCVLEQ
ncbi:MAG: hypothetical protein JO072_06950 [Parafilimonas sp.]|nr:hypothetical protein [Parafilimonas sp.]